MNDDLEVIWDGRHDGVNRDLLCVPPVVVRNMEHIVPADLFASVQAPNRVYQDHSEARARLLVLLAQRERWRIDTLRLELRLSKPVIGGLIHRLRRDRIVRTVGFGVIALIRRAA